MISEYTKSLLKSLKETEHIHIDWNDEKVVKITPIANKLTEEVMKLFIDWYKELGLPFDMYIRYNQLVSVSSFVEILKANEIKGDPFEYCSNVLTERLVKSSKPLRVIIKKCGLDKVKLFMRDNKERNFFKWNGQVYLLDIDDFFLVGYDKEGNEVNVFNTPDTGAAVYEVPGGPGRNIQVLRKHKHFFCY